ncbi:MAG TPA: sigma-70 family RNA polymerase sigma factor, partial [Gemmatimonadaceae bacterium]
MDAPSQQDSEQDDARLIDALKRRDEAAFVRLVERHHAPLIRLARVYAKSNAVAEEIVQETWLGVLAGIEGFEGRSSFKTWLFRICVNRARTRAERESRSVPFSALDASGSDAGPSVPADRFLPDSHPDWAGHWTASPGSWGNSPEDQLLQQETLELIQSAIAALPPSQ